MKKNILLILFYLSLVFYSCDEGFDPYGEYKDVYVFTCMLKSDETFQVAYLSHGYRPPGVDPYENTTDPSIDNSDIRIWYNNSVYVFKDTLIERTDTSRYKTPAHCYYNDQFAVENDKSIEVEVILPGGKRLKSSSETPPEVRFDDASETLVPPTENDNVQFIWNQVGDENIYLGGLTLKYWQNVNGEMIEKTKVIPMQYVVSNDEEVPVYPPASPTPNTYYEVDAITKSLQDISAGDPDKQNYSIYARLSFDLIAYDLPASKYVSSVSGSIDDLTVSENVSDYTNIEGGFGIFGSYTKKTYDRIVFSESYIRSFGYNFINVN